MMTASVPFEEARRLWREVDLPALKAGSYTAPLPHPNLVEAWQVLPPGTKGALLRAAGLGSKRRVARC